MKNYFEKFSIMFVMSLILMLGCHVSAFAVTDDDGVIGKLNLSNTTENSAKQGDRLTAPEKGWKRYDDTNSMIIYKGAFTPATGASGWYKSTIHHYATSNSNDYVNFKFYGTKLRTISTISNYYVNGEKIIIDDIEYSSNQYNAPNVGQALVFEISNLSLGIHKVKIIPSKSGNLTLSLDAIDIDDTGNLLPYNESISLDKSSMDLTIGESKQLTATTTPAGVEVEWSSSNPEIAKFDETSGKVIAGNAVGTATITAKIKGSETKATCTVNVTKPIEPTNPNPPVDEPTSGEANLFIELVDGNIKSYQVTSSQIQDFKQWYLDRDNTKSNKPYYEFTKGSYKDFVIHDKIDWFEVR